MICRVQALQEEITDIARNFAKERSKLEIAIAVKKKLFYMY